MNLIATCERLREMEQQATPRGWTCKSAGNQMDYEIRGEPELYILFQDSDINDPRFITDMRNAAPDLLAVLGGFRPGDSARIDALIYTETETAKFVAGFGATPDENRAMIDMLKRLHDMARQMEASDK